MQDTGIITQITPAGVLVKLEHSEQCKDCGLCTAGKTKYEIVAKDNIGVQVGDRVKVNIAPSTVLKFSFAVYIFPIIAASLGYFLTYMFLSKNEDAGIVGSMLFLFVSMFLVFYYRRKTESKRVECEISEKI